MSLEVGLDISSEVWIPDKVNPKKVWQSGVVEDITGGVVGVRVLYGDGTSERLEVPHPSSNLSQKPQLYLRNECLKAKGALAVHNLGKLPMLHEPAVLHSLQVRFDEGIVYTNTGSILLAVNPFREVKGLYDDTKLSEFSDLEAFEEVLEPHVFGVARAAYQGVWHHQIPQTVLISGESGAGKTETTKFVMKFLAKAGGKLRNDSADMSVQKQVLHSIPLLEALGNAKTKRNDNSSRFGKYIELHFAQEQAKAGTDILGPHLVDAKMVDYLLEKVRVTDIQEGERSYHIFYQALAAAAHRKQQGETGDSAVLHFNGVELRGVTGKAPKDFAYLRKSSEIKLKDLSKSGEEVDEAMHFEETLAAFRAFDVTEEDISQVLNAVISVLHLGNVKFIAPAGNSEGSVVEDFEEAGALAVASRLLGVEPRDLAEGCCVRTRKLPDGKSIDSSLTVEKAMDSRDALARHLYGAIFAFVVERVNSAVQRTSMADRGGDLTELPFVGVLDIFGFEVFDMNSFEQLCINFTNERLQQYFNEIIFEEEAKLYEKEGIRWDALDFPENNSIVDVLGKEPNGILPLLHSETIGWRQGSQQEEIKKTETWVAKMQEAHGKTKSPMNKDRPIFKKLFRPPDHFLVEHFAGEVIYAQQAFLEKNRDELSEKLVQCMKGSSSSFIKERLRLERAFGVQESVSKQTGKKNVKAAKQYSVSSEFRGQLNDLMDRIRSTAPHFVRCIKPNMEKLPRLFDRRSVVEQLRYQGVLQAIEVSRAGYPMRLPHRKGILEYRCLTPRSVRNHLETQFLQGHYASAARLLFNNLLDGAVPGLTDDNWAVGNTQIFLKRSGIEVLSTALSRRRHAAATTVQAEYQRHFYQKRYRRQRATAVRLQVAVRGFLARKIVRAKRRERAALKIQRCERGRVGRSIVRVRLNALEVLQAKFKAIHQQRRYVKTVRLIVKIQRWLRQVIPRAKARRLRMHGTTLAITCQRLRRGHLGRREFLEAKAARERFQGACRRVHYLWRMKTCKQLLQLDKHQRANRQLDDDMASSSADPNYTRMRNALIRPAQVIEAEEIKKISKRQRSLGILVASASAQSEINEALKAEAKALKSHNQMLFTKARDMQKWTPKGIVMQVLGVVCPCAAVDPPPATASFAMTPRSAVDQQLAV